MITGNEPAMPIYFEGNLGQMNSTGGLSKREYFAAVAFQAMLQTMHPKDKEEGNFTGYAQRAISASDTLIKQLNTWKEVKK